jgi:Leucine-rich repeat (LRR) protein
MPSKLLLCLLLSLNSSAQTVDEINAMQSISSQYPQLGWVGGNVCSWQGVTCDSSNHIVEINVSNQQLAGVLPVGMGDLVFLRKLFLSNNQFSQLPPALSLLDSLEELHIQNNQLQVLPDLSRSVRLVKLIASDNQFSEFPSFIPSLSRLENLNFANNRLDSIPQGISQLTNLKFLILNNNLITSLPANIGNLTFLERLILDNNRLSSLPLGLAQLTFLQFLYLGNNALTFNDLMRTNGTTASSFSYSPQDSVDTPSTLSIQQGQSVTMHTVGGNSTSNFQWIKDGSIIPGAIDSTYAFIAQNSTGIYTCRIRDAAFPSLTLFRKPIILTVLSNTNAVNTLELSVFPNPATDFISIKNVPNESIIRIFDSLGNEIFHTNKYLGQIEVSGFSSGVYWVQMTNSDEKKWLKMFVKK